MNCGHNDGIVLRSTGEVELLTTTGLPVGLFARAAYEEGQVTLATGDLLMIGFLMVGLGGALLLAFLDVGLTEERDRAREEQALRRRVERQRRLRLPRRPRRPG